MAVHQLIPSFVAGDATGQAALHLQLLLRRLGHSGELYAAEVGSGLDSLAHPVSALRPAPEDLVLYHHGIASPLSSRLMHLPCRRGVVFHNISPASAYAGTPLAEALVAGRAQLAAMAPFVDVAIGVSDYNSAELREAGYRHVHTVPLFVEPSRFAREAADKAMLARLAGPGPVMLSVSRVAPHKRFEDLLALHAELLKLRPTARLLMVGGYEPGSRYFRSLQRTARGLTGVHFLGRLDHAQLVAAYRSAQVFVSMSEHEGFGVPLIEAMAAELPVLAYGAAAVPETLGGAGIAFDEKRFSLLAELVVEVCDNRALREGLLAGQARRLEDFSAPASQAALAKALKTLPRPARRASGSRKKPRVGFVVQRYGEVTGGAERHAQQVVEQLAPHWDVTVLTTCAKNHLSWENVFPAGEQRDAAGARVLRFPVTRVRHIRPFNALSKQVFDRSNERLREEHWVAEQGPVVPGLLTHLDTHGADYDGFVFFTYLYAPTVWGLPLVADRALLVPTAHDEPPIRFGVYADVFDRPAALLCNTPEEVALIDRYFPDHAPARVVGVGVDVPGAPEPQRFRDRHGIRNPYLLYVGRLEAGKGIPELLAHYRELRARFHDAPDLVLAGEAHMDLRGEGVHPVGRISEQDKYDALAGALMVTVPSRFESLSLLTLEAFAAGTPVLVNGHSEVLVGQVERSGAGRGYTDLESFITGLREVGEQRVRLSRNAKTYAARYTWPRVVDAYREEMDRIIREKSR